MDTQNPAEQARRALKLASTDQKIREAVETAPPLPPEVAERLAWLLFPPAGRR